MGLEYLCVKKLLKIANNRGNGVVHVKLQLNYTTNVPHSFIFLLSEVMNVHIFGQTQASCATPEMVNFFSQNDTESKSIISEGKNIILKAFVNCNTGYIMYFR